MSGKRVVVRELGVDPQDGMSRCSLEDQEPPDAATLGDHDVAVMVCAASINWVDLIMTSGQYQHAPTLPYTPGLEYAGIVVARGKGVTTHQIGDAVMSDALGTGPRSKSHTQSSGGLATWAVAPEGALLPIPPGLSFDQACNLLGNYETAWHALVTCGRLQEGETALIHGASGGTGLAAVHIARHLGAQVIATGRSPEKLAFVREQGAHHTVQIRYEDGEPRFRDEVKALTGGRGAEVVYDGVGGDISLETLRCVAFGARFLLVGWAATPLVSKGQGQRGAPNANHLPTNLILMKGLHVMGCPAAISAEKDPSIRPPRLAAVLGLAAAGIRPVVASTFPLSEFREAMQAKWEARGIGGVVVRPN
jgi:NADPH2:quinone reductase